MSLVGLTLGCDQLICNPRMVAKVAASSVVTEHLERASVRVVSNPYCPKNRAYLTDGKTILHEFVFAEEES